MTRIEIPATRDHGWINAQTPRGVAPLARRTGTGKPHGDTRPMPVPTDSELRSLAHAACVDHVKVDGLRQKVCIARGADRAAVIAEARELAGVTPSAVGGTDG